EDHIGEAVMEVLAELDRARADDRDLAAESTHRWSPCLSGRLDVASSRPKPTPAPFGLASAESARGLYREGEERGSIPPCEPWCSSGRVRSRARPSCPPPTRYLIPSPDPAPGEPGVGGRACGPCRTDLHVIEGDLRPRRLPVIPGHQVVGIVDAVGAGATRFRIGDRVGIAWLRSACGRCRFCLSARENLCADSTYTGWTQ